MDLVVRLHIFFSTLIFCHRPVVKQDHYMTHLLSYANTIFWCSRCKIHRYVAHWNNVGKGSEDELFSNRVCHKPRCGRSKLHFSCFCDTPIKTKKEWNSKQMSSLINCLYFLIFPEPKYSECLPGSGKQFLSLSLKLAVSQPVENISVLNFFVKYSSDVKN